VSTATVSCIIFHRKTDEQRKRRENPIRKSCGQSL